MNTELGTREGSEFGSSQDSKKGGELTYLPIFPGPSLALIFMSGHYHLPLVRQLFFREWNHDCHGSLEGGEQVQVTSDLKRTELSQHFGSLGIRSTKIDDCAEWREHSLLTVARRK